MMKKAKERLDAEATYKMTWWERVDNAWYYYKWWLLGSVLVLGLVLMTVHDIRSNVAPDYSVGLLSPDYLPDAMIAQLETAITPYADDRNGDGKVVVQVQLYNVGVGEDTPSDPMTHAAGMTRLSSDMQLGDSMLFLSNRAQEYNRDFHLFTYNDGTLPPEDGPADPAKLGIPLAQIPALAAVGHSPTEGWNSEGFVLLKRGIAGTPLEEKEKSVAYFNASMELFHRLTTE